MMYKPSFKKMVSKIQEIEDKVEEKTGLMFSDIISSLSSEMLLKFRSNSKCLPTAVIGHSIMASSHFDQSDSSLKDEVRGVWCSALVFCEASSVFHVSATNKFFLDLLMAFFTTSVFSYKATSYLVVFHPPT